MRLKTKYKWRQLALVAAGWLQRKTSPWSSFKKKMYLIAYALVFGGISLFMMAGPFFGALNQERVFRFQEIHLPSHIGKPGDPPLHCVISKELFERIEAFRNNDSLVLAHPGLLDSIRLFEQRYQSQLKN